MKKRTRTYFAMALMVTTTLFISCSSDAGDDDSISLDDREQVILGQWVIIRKESDQPVDENNDGEFNTDLLANETEDCEKDDIFNFLDGDLKEFNRYDTTDDGRTTCHQDGVSYYIFQHYWQLSEDKTQLLLDTELNGEYDYPVEIVSMSQNEMELIDSYETTIEGGTREIINVTLVFTRIE